MSVTEFGEGENFDMATFCVSPVVQGIVSHVGMHPQETGQRTLKASVGSAFFIFSSLSYMFGFF